MADALELQVLGPYTLRGPDGSEIALRSRKAQALLGYLAVEEHATREGLANLLWGELNDERARHNVRQTLSKIRNDCGSIIVANGDSLCLNSRECSSDVARFVQLSARDDEASLHQCLDLYAGNLLENIAPKEQAFQDWLLIARQRLHHLACDAMDRYAQLLISGGRNEEAIAAINRRLDLDPACEPAHRNMMRVLAQIGRRSDALRQYRICTEALERELGAEPSPETMALHADIRDSSRQSVPARNPASSINSDPAPAAAMKLTVDSNAPRVAVLPFENLSSDADAYFADGITEDIITALSRFHSLHVIARGSTFVYKNKSVPDAEIAEALGAQFLVRGSVQRAGDRVRINVHLLDGPALVNIWSNRFDFEMTDVFRVQDEITSTVVSTLAGRVEATQLERARKVTAQRLESYDYLLRGKDHHHRFTADDCAVCIDLFRRAIDCDPDYAVAHAWLACGLGQAIVWGLDDVAALVDHAQAAAERGLELDENDSECHRVLAQVHLTRGNLTRALRHQERALFLNPNDDRSVCSMGEILAFAGRPEEAEQWVRKSMALNPYHPQRYWTHLARALLHQLRFSAALDILDQIGRPRRDDLAYAVVASTMGGTEETSAQNAEALRLNFPDFDIESFLAIQPYERTMDRELIRNALVKAGF